MSQHIAEGIFRVVGHLVEGWLEVQYIRHCDELPTAIPPPRGRVIDIRDDLWVTQIPISLVEVHDRLPNTLLKVAVRNRTEAIHVERAPST
jgi:hypothetical protein